MINNLFFKFIKLYVKIITNDVRIEIKHLFYYNPIINMASKCSFY